MKIPEVTEALRAQLYKDGLVLCRAADTSFGLDGERETFALRELAHAVEDWEETTDVTPSDVMQKLRDQSK